LHPLARHPIHDRPLRIGMLAPIAWRVPPRHYGPWERVVFLLTEGLVEAGADVTLFATADSRTGARLSAVVPSPYEETPGMAWFRIRLFWVTRGARKPPACEGRISVGRAS